MQFLFTPVFFLCLVFSAFAAPIPGNGTALNSSVTASPPPAKSPVVELTRRWILFTYSDRFHWRPPSSAVKMRNTVENLLPWFIPLLRFIKSGKDLDFDVRAQPPDQHLSFQAASLTQTGDTSSERDAREGYHVVEVKFPRRKDLDQLHPFTK
ncbi:hypothetical protein FB446DRAFT_700370 [Lentinula raphanica]|nr:hypothetical protein FB446DRAFT_700370 [Lentinula raphanica]